MDEAVEECPGRDNYGSGVDSAAELTGGYHNAFGCAAVFAAASFLLGATFLRTRRSGTAVSSETAPAEEPIRD